MGRPRTTGSRFKLGSEIDAKIADFCEANLGVTNATEIMRRAVTAYIDGFLANDREMKKRFDAASRKRLNMPKPKVVAFPSKGKD